MNPTSQSLPGFWSLYRIEPVIRGATTTMMLGLMLAGGIWWVIHPQPNAVVPVDPDLVLSAPWISLGGAAVALLAGSIALWRYLVVRRILGEGEAIKGVVEATDRHDTNTRSNSSTIQTTPTYAYYVTIHYEVRGLERTVRLKLPHSPGTYGLKKDGDVDLLVLESKPYQPLIRAIYLGRREG